MQQILGQDWHRLPPALQIHYAGTPCFDIGFLDIEYPIWMQPFLFILHSAGALIDRRGSHLPTKVHKEMCGDSQYWHRCICMPNGQLRNFDSKWQALPNGELVEYVNRFLGLRMKPTIQGNQLKYTGVCYIVKLWSLHLRLPEWLLGHTTIIETALDTSTFSMDFRLKHPLFGQIYRYTGIFSTNK